MLNIKNLSKVYDGKVAHKALADIDLTIEEGEFVGIMGPSGSGKSTLLNMVATIDQPTSGSLIVNGKDPLRMKHNDLALFRRRELGFIFQDFNLLPTLTVEENIVLPLTLDGADIKEMENRVAAVAEKLGISAILKKRIYEISGGQAQRTAIARAIIHNPKMVLADEPTGNLDSKASRAAMEMMERINKDDQTTMMMVTHDPIAASYTERVVFIKDGTLFNEIHRGENRQAFFQKIIDVLSLLGGDASDLSSIRV
ncbi:bacitracin ABC transporter ATP-binding protein [Virgibacillus soli]|uniref:Bacitracin ABC transporter ATP-binding protein n=1 Tax=Lederbergia galactosidilytica TaxID=217031 RepID=A0A177ZQL4_9BACI|nr:ABC transporter ATP-binding protein [Lederbergia galactosidilytica]KRG14945.1 bacitracin ABC transporter ATP-binding protein [Virgibacillus soli]OAK69178.1 bacitracin ABC transporter ATP-binding protein [Lederbergia galactosidilytica]